MGLHRLGQVAQSVNRCAHGYRGFDRGDELHVVVCYERVVRHFVESGARPGAGAALACVDGVKTLLYEANAPRRPHWLCD